MDELWLFSALVFLAVSSLVFFVIHTSRRTLREQRDVFTQQARVKLSELFLFANPELLWKLNVAALIVVPILVWLIFASTPLTLSSALGVALAPRTIYRWLKRRRFDQIHAQLPDALLMMSSALRGGSNITQALEALARDLSPPISQELALVVREQRLGAPFEEAVAHLAERVPSQDMELVASALRISREVGGNLADTLARLGNTVRRRLLMEQKIRALTSQGKLQGIVMTALPVLIILALLQIEPEAAGALFHTHQGWAVLAIGIVMEVLGYLSIRKIIQIEV